MSNKSLLKVNGFPRSGNTYLNFLLRFAYYPTERPNLNWHTAKRFNSDKVLLVPIRNPLDCISSWNLWHNRYNLDMDIAYYLRFHTAALKSNILTLEFDKFTNDFQYTYTRISKTFGIDPVEFPTDETIRESLNLNSRSMNLPRNNQEDLESIKAHLVDLPKFQACLDLYAELKTVS